MSKQETKFFSIIRPWGNCLKSLNYFGIYEIIFWLFPKSKLSKFLKLEPQLLSWLQPRKNNCKIKIVSFFDIGEFPRSPGK